ncbi:MAG: COG2426 family protein [Spirochaetota bacterium]
MCLLLGTAAAGDGPGAGTRETGAPAAGADNPGTAPATLQEGDHAPVEQRAVRLVSFLRARGMPPLLATGLIAVLPVFELRGGIPVGIALLELNPLAVFSVCVAFNMVPVLPVLLLLRPLRRRLGRVRPFSGLFRFFDRRVERRRELIERYEELGLILFVGVPLPVTGAWTGSILAALLDLRPGSSVLFIFLGVLLAGLVVTMLTLLGVYGLIAAAALLAGFGGGYLLKLRADLR